MSDIQQAEMNVSIDKNPMKPEETDTKRLSNEFVSKLQQYEEIFKNRYTDTDEAYLKRVNSKLEPFVLHPFGTQPSHSDFQQRPRQNWRGGGRWQHDGRRQENDHHRFSGANYSHKRNYGSENRKRDDNGRENKHSRY